MRKNMLKVTGLFQAHHGILWDQEKKFANWQFAVLSNDIDKPLFVNGILKKNKVEKLSFSELQKKRQMI